MNRIGRLLFSKVFLGYIIVAISLTALQIINEYNNQEVRLTNTLNDIAKTFEKPLLNAVWNIDEDQIKDNTQSIMSMHDIMGISIIDPDHIVLTQYGSVDNYERNYVNYLYEKNAVLYKNNLLKKSFPLIYKEDSSDVIGNVTLYASYDQIYENMKEHVYIIILNSLLKSLALYLLFLFFTNKIITQPLNNLIEAIKKTRDENYQQIDTDTLDIQKNTELKTLYDNYNDMQERIEIEVDKNKAFQTFFEESTDGLMILEKGRCIDCNQAALNTLGIKSKNLLYGLRPSEVSPELQPDGHKSSIKEKEMMHFALTNGSHNFEWVYTGPNGEDVWGDVTLTPITMNQRDIVYVSCRDISRRKKAERVLEEQKLMLHRLANNDPLTGLPNRLYFTDRLDQAISMAKQHNNELAVLFIDLDRFKPINDSLGHTTGDKVLSEIAVRLQNVIRKEDTLARLGGDEFIILMENLFDKTDAAILAEKILGALVEPIYIDEHILYVSCSIGISLYPQDDGSVYNLIKYADAAMYKAKAEGRNNFQFYSSDLTETALERVSLESKLRQSLDKEEFLVYYQAQINSENGELIGMEALVRWNHNNMEIIPPSKFIALAEETGLIVPLDQWVMRKALTQVVQWYKIGLNPGVLALNLSMKQLHRDDFIPRLKSILEETGCKPEWVSLEVTESQIMKDPENVIDTLGQISEIGIEIAIDDFGTGYSSLSYLKRLPIDKLKIDQTFIKDLPHDEEDASIVQAVIVLSKSLNINIIAEGVETEDQKKFLIENGCRDIQGYIYGQPMMATKMEEILKIKCHNKD